MNFSLCTLAWKKSFIGVKFKKKGANISNKGKFSWENQHNDTSKEPRRVDILNSKKAGNGYWLWGIWKKQIFLPQSF